MPFRVILGRGEFGSGRTFAGTARALVGSFETAASGFHKIYVDHRKYKLRVERFVT